MVAVNILRIKFMKIINFGGSEYVVRLYAEAVNAQSLSKGEYTDQITVTVNF
jgi:hypothetical protein